MKINLKKKGSLINEGSSRKVFHYGKQKKYVIKKAKNQEGIIHNWTEFLVYQWSFLNPKHNRLAKVYAISNNGRYLIMEHIEKVGTLSLAGYINSKVFPKWTTDHHDENIGVKDRRWILVDYGDDRYLTKLFSK